MSTIVVVIKNAKVVMGADTQQSQGSIKISNAYHRGCEKIMKHGGTLVGTVGSTAINLVLRSLFKRHGELIDFHSADGIFETFRKAHPVLRDEYYIQTDENDDEDQEFESNQIFALIANKTGAYDVQSYREVQRVERFWAIGTGKRFALGAMHAVYEGKPDPVTIAEAGLKAACEFDDGSGPPLQIETIAMEAVGL